MRALVFSGDGCRWILGIFLALAGFCFVTLRCFSVAAVSSVVGLLSPYNLLRFIYLANPTLIMKSGYKRAPSLVIESNPNRVRLLVLFCFPFHLIKQQGSCLGMLFLALALAISDSARCISSVAASILR